MGRGSPSGGSAPDPGGTPSLVRRLAHPRVGDIEPDSDKPTIDGTDEGLTLVVLHAEPGSRSAGLLKILGSLTAAPGGPAGDLGNPGDTGSRPHAEGPRTRGSGPFPS
ncbi:hypothetical protein ACH4UM_22230 [Streptomyces sp. NPDC020801]|uniref:hypothetical protein n=1 Tax=Streptomyces sp. NPDC020801 TaxID=3365093 RepID=UPI0037A84DD1